MSGGLVGFAFRSLMLMSEYYEPYAMCLCLFLTNSNICKHFILLLHRLILLYKYLKKMSFTSLLMGWQNGYALIVWLIIFIFDISVYSNFHIHPIFTIYDRWNFQTMLARLVIYWHFTFPTMANFIYTFIFTFYPP